MEYASKIRIVEGFPHAGISFKDISTLLADKEAFHAAVDDLSGALKELSPDAVVGPESRGFVLGAPAAYAANLPFIMARKPGKLPGETKKKTYQIEYGVDSIEIPSFAIHPGMKVVLVDDLMATGGTFKALKELIEEMGGKVIGIVCLIELTDLKGRDLFPDVPLYSFVKYAH